MPPKRTFNDSDDDDRSSAEDTTTEEESDEEEQRAPVNHQTAVDTSAGGQFITNNPNDEAFDVEDDDDEKSTPPQGALNASGSNGLNTNTAGAVGGAHGASASAPGAGNTLMNNPNDEAFEVEDDNQRHVPTPQADGGATAQGRLGESASAAAAGASGADARIIKNDKHDEFSDVEDDDEEEAETPPRHSEGGAAAASAAAAAATGGGAGAVGGANLISNDHHDEAIDIDGSSAATTPERSPQNYHGAADSAQNSPAGGAQQQQQQLHSANNAPRGQMRPDDDDEDEDDDDEDVETSDDEEGGNNGPMMGQMTAEAEAAAAAEAAGQQLYRSSDYAYLRNKVDPEVFELFGLIDQFVVTPIELPTKFRPFVPEFIPCVGDIDAFCKVPRPDGLPDGLGLHVIDEPSTYQSNPAVVKMNLEYGSKMTVRNQHVESIADASTRPGLIDRWVAEIKDTHAKKPLPSVNYSKPMPDIEELLQVWPQEFEELLSSDLQFPPPSIDLDIEQYCRVMCTVLDIPIYDNIIESLHVMFTLFLEFRANQHFQHN